MAHTLFDGDENNPLRPVDPNVREIDEQRLTGQNAIVLEHLRRGAVLDAKSALDFGVMRLAARIHDLRAFGVVIRDRFDGPIKSYWIENKAAAGQRSEA